MCKWQPTNDKLSLIGVCLGHVTSDPLQIFWGSNHITGTAEPKVVKVCTWVGNINSSNRMAHHQQKCGYGHVTVLKFCRLSRCSTPRGFVNDSWATCLSVVIAECRMNIRHDTSMLRKLGLFLGCSIRPNLVLIRPCQCCIIKLHNCDYFNITCKIN